MSIVDAHSRGTWPDDSGAGSGEMSLASRTAERLIDLVEARRKQMREYGKLANFLDRFLMTVEKFHRSHPGSPFEREVEFEASRLLLRVIELQNRFKAG